MSLASSSSSMRTVLPKVTRTTLPPARQLATYSPSTSSDIRDPPRRSRPGSPTFFTGKPTYHEALTSLSTSITEAKKSLRQEYIYPLPSTLPQLQLPRASWHGPEKLSTLLKTGIRTNSHREILKLLNELHGLRHVAFLSGRTELEGRLNEALRVYEREVRDESGSDKEEKSGVDEFGRAYAMGRRKESSARVWMIPTKSATEILDTERPDLSTEGTAATATAVSTPAEILINHLPLPLHFPRITDRDTVMRPFRLTGLHGAYNVFALVRGGGTTGQAGAVALAVARALAILREDVRDVLKADGALMRDTRMVERKKTGRAKARKAYTWVKR